MYRYRGNSRHSGDLNSGHCLASVLGKCACQVAMSKVLPNCCTKRWLSAISVLGRKRLGSKFPSPSSPRGDCLVVIYPQRPWDWLQKPLLPSGQAARKTPGIALKKVARDQEMPVHKVLLASPWSFFQFIGHLEFPWELVSWSFKQLQPSGLTVDSLYKAGQPFGKKNRHFWGKEVKSMVRGRATGYHVLISFCSSFLPIITQTVKSWRWRLLHAYIPENVWTDE